MKTRSFLRWMPTAIILWAFGVIFAVAAMVSLQDARHAAQGHTDAYYRPTLALIGETQHAAGFFIRGAIADGLVAGLCILAWHLMRRHHSSTLAFGGIAVMVAAYIICQRSIIYLFRSAGFAYWGDLLFETPFLIYVFLYAYQECKKAAA